MKLRKVLAGLLCSAMIFTEMLGSVAYASEINVDEATVTMTEETQESEETEITDADDVTDGGEVGETSAESGEDDNQDKKDVEESETEDKEDNIEEKTESPDAKDETLEEAEKAEEEITEEIADGEEETEELLEELLLEDSLLEVEESNITDAGSSDLFVLDAGGKLKLAPDKSLPTSGTLVIPGKIGDTYVKIIPSGLFSGDGCKIQRIEFEKDNQIETIEEGAFAESQIEKFFFPAPYYDDSGDKKCVKIVADNTFIGCSRLSVVDFNGCEIDKIGKNAFSGTAITSFTAPGEYTKVDGVKTVIEAGAFEDCKSLRSIYLYEVETVGNGAFKNCTSLGKAEGSVRVTLDQKSFGDKAFANCGFTVLDFREATGLVNGYGKNLFEGCLNLTEAYLPSAKSDISEYMFADCSKLRSVHMGIKYDDGKATATGKSYYIGYPGDIGKYAFKGCSAIQSITLPDTVMSIGESAFEGCTGLATFEVLTNIDNEALIEDTFIQRDSLPDKESALTVKGYMDFLEEYSLKKGYKYVALDNKVDVKASFGGSELKNATVAISPAKAKPGQMVTVTVTHKDSTTTLLPNANGSYISLQTGNWPVKYYNNFEQNVRVETCTPTVQKFTFTMPNDVVKGDLIYVKGTVVKVSDYAAAESKIFADFSKKSVGVDFIGSDPLYDYSPHIAFKKTGQQLTLRFEDSDGRVIAPWRIKYSISTAGQKMVSVSADGVVSAISDKSSVGKATITAKLGTTTVDIIATVDDSANINEMGFGIYNAQMPKRSKYKGTNIDGTAAGSREYTRKEAVYDKDGKIKEYVDKSYDMIVVPKTAVQNDAISFKLNVHPRNTTTGTEDYMVSTAWTSADTSVAKVASATSTTNENTITIPKGALGDTEIRVKVTNAGEKEDSDNRTFENSFIVRVINDIPRLTGSSIVINTNSDTGTLLPIVVADDFDVDDEELHFVVKKTVNKIVTYEENEYGVIINKADGEYYARLKASKEPPQAGKTVEYKNLILTGRVGGEEFRIPISSVKVANTSLSSKVTLSGKINLFYRNDLIDDETKELRGKVKVTQGLTSEEVYKEILLSDASYKEMMDEEVKYNVDEIKNPSSDLSDLVGADKLGKNFTITKSNGQWYIERSTTAMEKDDNGKDVLSGYIFTYFKGFPMPVIQKITVPTENVKPSYALDYTTTTVNTNKKGTSYNLMLVDSKTKKPPICTWVDDNNVTHKYYRNLLDTSPSTDRGGDKSATGFEYNVKSTTSGLFDTKFEITSKEDSVFLEDEPMKLVDPEDATKTVDFKPYKLKVQLADVTPFAGKAVLRVKLYNWTDYIDYTFDVKTTATIAKPVMKATTVTYNTSSFNAAKLPAELEMSIDQTYAYIADLGVDGMTGTSKYLHEDMSDWGSVAVKGHIKCTNSAKNAADEESIKTLMKNMYVRSAGKNVIIGVKDASAEDIGIIKTGNYTFSFVPRVKYSATAAEADYKKMSTVKFTIAVTKNAPGVKLSTTSFKFNGNYPGQETGKTVYSFTNVPTQLSSVADEDKYKFDVTGYTVNCKEKITDSHASTDSCATHYADRIAIDTFDDTSDNNKNKMSVSLNAGPVVPDFKRTFSISDTTLKLGDDIEVPLAVFDTAVETKTKGNTIGVDYKTTGSINPVDPKSGIVVTVTVKNLVTNVVSDIGHPIKIWEVNDTATDFVESDKLKAELITEDNYSLTDSAKKYYGFPNIAVDSNKKPKPNQIIITPIYKDDESGDIRVPMVKDKKYEMKLTFSLASGDAWETKIMTISPNQVVPGLSAAFAMPKTANSTSMTTTMYACNGKQSDCLVRINPKSQSNAEIIGVALASNASAALKRAYAVEYYDAIYDYANAKYKVYHVKKDGTREGIIEAAPAAATETVDKAMYDMITESEDKYRRSFKTDEDYKKTQGHYYVYVKLLNAAPLVMNKGTNVDIEVRYKNQIKDNLGKNTPGSTFRINITVKK